MLISALTGGAVAFGGTNQIIFAIGVGESTTIIDLTPLAVGTVVCLSVFMGVLTLVMYFAMMQDLGSLKANLTHISLLVAVAIGWMLLGEQIHLLPLIGFVMFIAGFALLERSPRTSSNTALCTGNPLRLNRYGE